MYVCTHIFTPYNKWYIKFKRMLRLKRLEMHPSFIKKGLDPFSETIKACLVAHISNDCLCRFFITKLDTLCKCTIYTNISPLINNNVGRDKFLSALVYKRSYKELLYNKKVYPVVYYDRSRSRIGIEHLTHCAKSAQHRFSRSILIWSSKKERGGGLAILSWKAPTIMNSSSTQSKLMESTGIEIFCNSFQKQIFVSFFLIWTYYLGDVHYLCNAVTVGKKWGKRKEEVAL